MEIAESAVEPGHTGFRGKVSLRTFEKIRHVSPSHRIIYRTFPERPRPGARKKWKPPGNSRQT